MKRTRIYAYIKQNLKFDLEHHAREVGDSASEVTERAIKAYLEAYAEYEAKKGKDK